MSDPTELEIGSCKLPGVGATSRAQVLCNSHLMGSCH